MTPFARRFARIAALLALCAPVARGQGPLPPPPDPAKPFRAARRETTDALIAGLSVPEGFALNVFARDAGNARMMAVGPDGTVYLTRPAQGSLLAMKDADGDGKAENVRLAVEGIEKLHGVAIQEGRIYLANVSSIMVGDLDAAGAVGPLRTIVSDLPHDGGHWKRTLGIGPDGMLYVSIGSNCDACPPTGPEFATIARMGLDGSGRRTVARGLRNTMGFDWHPATGELWGMDQGRDGLGDDLPPEELNRLEDGKDYGWPYAYGNRIPDPKLKPVGPDAPTVEEYAAATEPPVLEYQAHAAAIGMTFYDAGQFPERYRGGAFVGFRGSSSRRPPVGHCVTFIRFEDGKPAGFEDFVTGFVVENGTAQFGRIAGVAVAKDGSLLFTDDEGGYVYRVAWRGAKR